MGPSPISSFVPAPTSSSHPPKWQNASRYNKHYYAGSNLSRNLNHWLMHLREIRPGDMQRALARVDTLQRSMTSAESQHENATLFRNNVLPPLPDRPPQPRSSFGKFNAVNATFIWGKLEPSFPGRQTPPVIYAKHHRPPSRACSTSSTLSSDIETERSAESISTSGIKRMRLIGEYEPILEPPRKVRPISRPADNSDYHLSTTSLTPRSRCSGQKQCLLTTESQSEQRLASPILPSHGSLSAPKATEQKHRQGHELESWQKYAEMQTAKDGKIQWKCKWQNEAGECYYNAKKQLVKRHVETVHLDVKRFQCTYCPQRYAQKTSLEVHTASAHTGQALKKCPYESCDMSFKDPARLHRHKIDSHGYVPRLTVRKKSLVKKTMN